MPLPAFIRSNTPLKPVNLACYADPREYFGVRRYIHVLYIDHTKLELAQRTWSGLELRAGRETRNSIGEEVVSFFLRSRDMRCGLELCAWRARSGGWLYDRRVLPLMVIALSKGVPF